MPAATRLVVQTPRSRMSPMSTSGAAIRRSNATQPQNTVAATAKRASSRAESQPQRLPSVMASRNATSATESSAAPTTSTRAGVRTGDSGTNAHVSTAAGTVTTSADQNSHDRPTCSTSSPASTSAAAPPMPSIEESVPIPTATRSRGSSSRTMPIASGRIAAPVPLHDAAGDHDREGAGNRRQQAAHAEDDERHQQHARLAVHVAEAAQQRGGDGRAEQEARE